jgi:NAD(P)-dependent dehydrogenase (short-subunit alcohol dehydrogenase family)
MRSRHEGRVAVVTGAASGIGQAYARRLAEDGADIAIADISFAEETEAFVAMAGRQVLSKICDVSSQESVNAFARATLEHFGRVDILVNNAGIYPTSSFAETDFALWRKVLAINLDGAFLMCKAFVPSMQKRRWGRIINITSGTVWLPTPLLLAYISSKAAIIGLTRSLATELGAEGITVNAIAPGLVKTQSNASGPHPQEDFFARTIAQQAIKRQQLPEDLVGTVSFLASDDAAFLTGQTISVDGGVVRL